MLIWAHDVNNAFGLGNNIIQEMPSIKMMGNMIQNWTEDLVQFHMTKYPKYPGGKLYAAYV